MSKKINKTLNSNNLFFTTLCPCFMYFFPDSTIYNITNLFKNDDCIVNGKKN